MDTMNENQSAAYQPCTHSQASGDTCGHCGVKLTGEGNAPRVMPAGSPLPGLDTPWGDPKRDQPAATGERIPARYTLKMYRDDMGSFTQPGCRNIEDALWHVNNAREHDGLAPISIYDLENIIDLGYATLNLEA